MLENIKEWQEGLGAVVGFVGLIVVTQVTLWDARRRNRRSKQEQTLSVAVAIYGEMLLLREKMASLGKAASRLYVRNGLHGGDYFDSHFVHRFNLPDPHLYPALASKVGELPADLVRAITRFYFSYSEAQKWLPMIVPDENRPFEYGVNYVLDPILSAVVEIEPALVQIEFMGAITPAASRPDLGETESVIEMIEDMWGN